MGEKTISVRGGGATNLHDHLYYLVLCWVLAEDAEDVAYIPTRDTLTALPHNR